jgi:hypothetical protein
VVLLVGHEVHRAVRHFDARLVSAGFRVRLIDFEDSPGARAEMHPCGFRSCHPADAFVSQPGAT